MNSRLSQKTLQEQDNMKRSIGKIYKGTLNDAPMKVKVASIPCKFENVVYRNNKVPAFGNSRDRFYSHLQNIKRLEPGPGNYENANTTQQKIFSKKGYGSLISNTKLDRLQRKYTGLPGPGAYNPKQALLSRTKRSNSLALLSSKLQGHQLFKNQLNKTKFIPGPGVYNLRLKKSSSQSYAFSNNVQRFDNSINNEQTPGVGHYHYEESNILRHQSSHQKIQYKRAGPQINEISYQQKLKVVRQILNNTKKNIVDNQKNVGPGTYNTKALDKKQGFKIHETSYDRFGQPGNKSITAEKVKQFMNEEPDASMFAVADQVYNVLVESKERFSSTKALTSMFKSNIARYDFVKADVNDPGRYSPEKPDKKSHLVNFQKKWV